MEVQKKDKQDRLRTNCCDTDLGDHLIIGGETNEKREQMPSLFVCGFAPFLLLSFIFARRMRLALQKDKKIDIRGNNIYNIS